MSQLAILSMAERRRFDQPPVFNKEERRRHFLVPADVRLALSRIKTQTNKAGFLLQFGYFQATGRFFSTELFRRRDIDYLKRLFKLETVELAEYSDRMARQHRQSICTLLNWHKIDATAREELVAHTQRHVVNQEYPKRILVGLTDLCWKRQWVIPAYTELADIITESFNVAEHELLSAVQRLLTPQHIKKLEGLLQPIQRGPDAGSAAPLTLLKRIDQSLNVGAIKRSLDTLVLFRDHFLALAPVLDNLTLSDKATDYYATWLTKADHQQLLQFPNRHKAYLHLLAFIKHQFYRRQDHSIDVLLKSVTAARSFIRKQLNQQDQVKQKERNLAIEALRQAQLTASQFANGVIAITHTANATPNEKYYKIEALVHDYLASLDPVDVDRFASLDSDIQKARKNSSYYDLLSSSSLKLQRRVADVVRTVVFDEQTSDANLMAAIEHFKSTDGRIGVNPPSAFLTPQDHDAVFADEGIVIPLYKSLLFIHMADRVKSGHLNLKYSYRYRAIQDYLIPQHEWQANKSRILRECGLAEYADGVSTLAGLKNVIHERFSTVNGNFLADKNPHMSVGADGRSRVATPKTDYESRSFIASTLTEQGIVPILDLLKGIDRVCQFTIAFKHFSTKHSKMKPTNETLMAGILAQGCNIGLNKLAKISTGIDIDILRNTVNWCFSQENIRAANRKITDVIQALALANNYVQQPPLIHSSSDGRKMTVAVDSMHASYSYKYFGQEKGVTDYTFIDERQALTHTLVFSSSDREAPYVLDGLVDNPVTHGLIHSTDTHGFTEQIFGAANLMGISFAPRIANLHQQRLYGFSTRRTYQKMGYPLLPSRTINQKLILNQWDDILRFIATIKSHRSTASQLFKRLSSYAKDHPLYKALKEYGRIIKTQFLLTYYDDMELRQRIQKQLNLVEQANKFSRAVFFDNDQAFQDGSLQQQQAVMDCKLLLQNSIILWNYLSLSDQIINTSDADERVQLIEAIRRGSVITWSHVNLRGEYSFTPPSANDPVFDIEKIKALKIK